MLCWIDNILQNIPSFRVNVRNIPHNTVSSVEHCFGFEYCYEMGFGVQFQNNQTYVQEEQVVSCRWTGWVRDITRWSSSRLQKFTILEESIEYTSNAWNQNQKMSTCNWWDLGLLRISTNYIHLKSSWALDETIYIYKCLNLTMVGDLSLLKMPQKVRCHTVIKKTSQSNDFQHMRARNSYPACFTSRVKKIWPGAVIREIFGQHNRLRSLVFASPTGLHVDILRVSFINLGYIL